MSNSVTSTNLEHLVDLIPSTSYSKNKDGVYLSCSNPEILGFKDSLSIVGKTDHALFSKVEADKIREHDLQVIQSGKTLIASEYITLFNGEKIQFLVERNPLKDKSGRVIGLGGVSVDLSKTKNKQNKDNKASFETLSATLKHEQSLQHLHPGLLPMIAEQTAHDLQTQFDRLNSSISALSESLETFEYSTQNEEISRTLELSKRSLSIISNELSSVDDYIASTPTMLLKFVLGITLEQGDLQECYIQAIIYEALMRYPFTDNEKTLINIDIQTNFSFLSNKTLIIYNFFNLIKNSLERINKKNKGEIYIRMEQLATENRVTFKDTAGGTPAEVVAQLFDSYEIVEERVEEVGLSYYRKVNIKNFGDMTCHSVEEDYTEFVMTFPIMK